MIDRLSLLCFAGTYALALVSDLTRLIVRSSTRWHFTIVLTSIGWLVHTAFLANLAWQVGEVPIGTVFQSLLVLAWLLAGIDLYLMARAPKPVAVGVFVLPVILVLLIAAGIMPERARADWTQLVGWKTIWGTVHGVLLIGGAVSTSVAFAAGLMYMAQADRLKHRRTWRIGITLPSLEQSERWNYWAITLGFPLLSAGLLIGVALNAATRSNGRSVLDWSDPKIISAAGLWVLFAILLHVRYRPQWRGRRVMLLTIIAFAYLLFTLIGVDLLLPTAHGVALESSTGQGGTP